MAFALHDKTNFFINMIHSNKAAPFKTTKVLSMPSLLLLCTIRDKIMYSTQERYKNNFPKSFVSKGNIKSKGRYTHLVEPITLFSVDQIREEASPWKALTEKSKNRVIKGKGSAFKKRLQERKKLRMLYGNLPQRALNRYLRESPRPEDLLLLLESRLDITLKRSALFPSIQSARRSILKGGILVNHTIVRSPRYHCMPGDLIQVAQRPVLASFAQCDYKDLAINQGLSIDMFNVLVRPKTYPFKERASKVFSVNQSDRLLCPCTFLELWFLSELLQSWSRRTGRLYGSMLSHSRLIKESMGSALERKRSPLVINTFDRAFTNLTNRMRFSDYYKQLFTKPPRDMSFNEKIIDNENATSDLSQPIANESARLEQPLSQVTSSRPLHIEVSYRDLCVIFLYPPQRICLDVSIDLSLIC